MGITGIVVVVVLAVGALLALVVIGYYNSFVTKRNMSEQAFSTIDVMLKKRCDLVPNLVATAKQYMTHENETLTQIAAFRSRITDPKASPDSRVAANNQMNRLIGDIMVQVEKYPDLKANQNFTELGRTLNDLEEQLSAARRTFNAAVTSFNNSVEMFPGSLVANSFGFKRLALLEIPAEDRKNPDVHALFNR